MISAILTVLNVLPVLGCGALVFFAQTQVKERSELASLAITIGAGVELVLVVLRFFPAVPLVWMAAPVLHVVAIGAVVRGLFALLEALNPKRTTQLPILLSNLTFPKPNVATRVMAGVFGLFALGSGFGYGHGPLGVLVGAIGLVGVLFGSLWVDRQGPLALWVLQRKPENVVWSYVHQLRVVNQRSGSSTTHWTARVGLSTGALVLLPAASEVHAQQLIGALFEVCPGIAVGYSAENLARFKSAPASMRGGASVPTTTLR